MAIIDDDDLLKKIMRELKESNSEEAMFSVVAREKNLTKGQTAQMKNQAELYSFMISRIFSEENAKIKNEYIVLKDENGKFTKQVKLTNAYRYLADFFESRKEIDFGFNQDENTEIINFIISTFLANRAIRLYEQPTKDYQEFVIKVNASINELKTIAGEDKVILSAAVMFSDPGLRDLLKRDFNIQNITDDDILQICQNFLGEEYFKKFWNKYGGVLVEKRNIIKKLEALGYITPEMYRNHEWSADIVADYIFARQEGKEKAYLLRYAKSNDLFTVYLQGLIKAKDLEKHTTPEDLLLSNMDKNDMIKILRSVKYNKSASLIIWEQFDKDFWTVNEVRELANLKYIKLSSIVKKYREEMSRKIAQELEVKPTITEEKLLEMFTPEFVLEQELLSEVPEELKSFFVGELSQIYAKKELDLQAEIIKCVKNKNEQDPDNMDKTLIELYQKGYITTEKLKDSKISEEILIKYYLDHGSDRKIFIEFYNNGLLSNDTVLEMFGDNTDVLFDMIRSGLNVSAIQTWYSTAELLNFYKAEKMLTIQNLIDLRADLDFSQIAKQDLDLICRMIRLGLDSTELKGVFSTETLINLLFAGEITTKDLIKLKDDIDIEELKRLYLSEDISYSQLYGLAKDGIIKIDDANAINEDYNFNESLYELMQRGLKGCIVQPISTSTKTTRTRNPNSTQTKTPQGLDPKLKNDLFLALGSKGIEISTKDCPVFSGYKLIPLMSKKVCILEGDGRTCVMPLKIAFEQLQNPDQRQNDILGTATCRKDVYSNKTYVTPLNHSKNWGVNLVDAVVERSSSMTKADGKIFKNRNKKLLEDLQKSHEERKKQK